jgi:hypothetical protein
MKKIGNWTLPQHIDEFNVNEWIGFVYIIQSPENRYYIGKKNFHSITKKTVKGKIRKQIVCKESNWKTYTGSSKALNEDISKMGIENFKFYILSLHESRSSLAYFECKFILASDALLNSKFYNRICPPIKWTINISDKEKATNYNCCGWTI